MEIISIDNLEREFGNGETTSMGKLENVSFFSGTFHQSCLYVRSWMQWET